MHRKAEVQLVSIAKLQSTSLLLVYVPYISLSILLRFVTLQLLSCLDFGMPGEFTNQPSGQCLFHCSHANSTNVVFKQLK